MRYGKLLTVIFNLYMKTRRNLSGIFFREKNHKTGKWENVCFEDLPEDRQKEIVAKNGKEWVGNLAIILSNTLNEIGDQLDLMRGDED